MRLKINLSSESLGRAIQQMEECERTMQEKCEELSRRLAELGLDVVNATYVGAAYAGTNDIAVHLEFTDNGCKIVASGSVLGFIEFGTGVSYPLGEYAAQAGAPAHGTYGQGRGKQSKWVYKGEPGNLGQPDSKRPGLVWTSGNPPANAFPAAVKEMREQAEEIAREVFRFD